MSPSMIDEYEKRIAELERRCQDLETIIETTSEHADFIEAELEKRNQFIRHLFGRYVTEEVVEQILDLLETRVRPAVAQDGGDILYRGFDSASGTVYLTMRGACSGCPSSRATLKGGIEKMLKHYVPEVRTVEAV
jgi:Fe-S cluster biogenesis protein NfuA